MLAFCKHDESDLHGDELAGYAELYHEIFLVVHIQLNLTKFPHFQLGEMSTADDIHVDAKPNGHADGGDFRHHHRRRARRSTMASSSGTVTDGNSLYFSETDSDAVADGSLPVALTDEPLLMCNSSRGSPGTLVVPRGRQRLDCPVLPVSEDEEVDLERGESELNLQNNGDGRGFRCRICHLNLEGNYDDGQGDEDSEGVPVELGCSCKGDLGVAHEHCAETWFQIKGDRICEICGSIALNFMVELENEVINIEVASQASEAGSETHEFKHGHLVLTFMIAFMVLTFVISYIFHTKNLNRED
ncbi:uncharacterized protein [Primulina huaijiensis]|uniref:uncharacterized protein isoform X1 n=2 Tax=Primulina huaijiensis TaxID=1492673 RepID=UPI003CC70188